MTKEEILSRLCEIISLVKPNMDLSGVSFESSLTTDLGIDSLSMLLMSLAIEEKFNMRFENTATFQTVGDICDYIGKRAK